MSSIKRRLRKCRLCGQYRNNKRAANKNNSDIENIATIEKNGIPQDITLYLSHVVEIDTSLSNLSKQVAELSQQILGLNNGLKTTEANTKGKSEQLSKHLDEQLKHQGDDDDLLESEKSIKNIYTSRTEEEIDVFYSTYKSNAKIKLLCVIKTDTLETFIQSCHTKDNLKRIYELILLNIRHNNPDGEWDLILDGFLNIYNHENNTNYIRQPVSKGDLFDKTKHESINGQSNNGDPIKTVIFRGIVDSKTNALLSRCPSRITTV